MLLQSRPMLIGINALFLRKPGTGIGQVSVHFIQTLLAQHTTDGSSDTNTRYILYTEEPIDFDLPAHCHNTYFLPRYWKRDDLIRQWLWEQQVARQAMKDGCDAFISLYQSSTIFPETTTINHTMVTHDIIPKLFPAYRGNLRQAIHWKMVERGITQAHHIVSVSKHTKDDLIRELAIPEDKISVVYPAVAPRFHTKLSHEALMAILQKYKLQSGYIYHGGGLEIRKNTERLLQAYKQLRDTTNNIPPLVISGKIHSKNNPLATNVEDVVKRLGLQEYVRLLGFIPDTDMPAIYQGALFFVYPSLYEGFGLPVLEALALGVPTLTSAVSSLPEVGGNAVIYTDPKNIQDIASQMTRLLNDATLRATLASRGTQQALQFNWESFAQNILHTVEKSPR